MNTKSADKPVLSVLDSLYKVRANLHVEPSGPNSRNVRSIEYNIEQGRIGVTYFVDALSTRAEYPLSLLYDPAYYVKRETERIESKADCCRKEKIKSLIENTKGLLQSVEDNLNEIRKLEGYA